MIAMPVLLISVTLFSGTVVSMIRQRSINLEAASAAYDVQSLFERMRNEDLEDLFALYNADPLDDPDGPGTAPGNRFEVDGLTSLDAVPGPVGEVLLPAANAALPGAAPVYELREDLLDAALGMPRDLSGDFVVDGENHAGDYDVLPVVARVHWLGEFGVRELEMYTLLTRYQNEDE
jgi:hypothetical protein